MDEINKDRSFKTRQFQRPLKQTVDIQNESSMLKIDFIKTMRHFSCCDLKDLKKLNLKDMTVNKIHFGHYLECTVITKPMRTCGINFQVRDSDDQTENIALYNYEFKSVGIDPEVLLPVGSKLIIKEPYMQTVLGSLSDQREFQRHSFDQKKDVFVIRVDSPTDLIVLAYGMSEKKVDLAQDHILIRAYSEEIEKTHNLKTYIRRSRAYLNLEKYSLAFHDALKASLLNDKNVEAYLLMGVSSYAMRKYENARENFQNCLKLNPKNEMIKQELEKTNTRIAESKTGVYDLQAVVDKFRKKKNGFYIDVSDYKSDQIQIFNLDNKSKGVKAIKAIPRGETISSN